MSATDPIVTRATPPTTIDLWPIDGSSDDAGAIKAAVERADGTSKRRVRLFPGFAGQAFQILSEQEWLVSTCDVELMHGAVVNFGLSTAQNGWLVRAQVDATVTSTTLSATPAVGATSLSCVGYVATGKWVRVDSADGDRAQQFEVLSVTLTGTVNLTTLVGGAAGDLDGKQLTAASGTNTSTTTLTFNAPANATAVLAQINAVWPGVASLGSSSHLVLTGLRVTAGSARSVVGITSSAYVLAIDVPTAFRFTSGDAVAGRTLVTAPRLSGAGKLTGTAAILVNFSGVRGGSISGVTFDCDAPFACGFDVGSRAPTIENVSVDNTSGTAVYAHICVNPIISKVHGGNVPVGAVVSLESSRGAKVVACDSEVCDVGLSAGSFEVGGDGTTGTSVGCEWGGAATDGVRIVAGSVFSVIGGSALEGAGNGLIAAAESGAAPSVYVGGGFRAQGNAFAGISISAATAVLDGCIAGGNGSANAGGYGDYLIAGASAITARGCVTDTPAATAGVRVTGAARLDLTGMQFTNSRASTWYGINSDAAGSVIRITGADFSNSGGGTGVGILGTGGNGWILSGCHVVGAALTEDIDVQGTGNWVRLGADVKMSLASGNTNASAGTITLNGTTDVSKAFVDIAATDVPMLTPITPGGTAGDLTVVVTAGASWKVKSSQASDTRVLAYRF